MSDARGAWVKVASALRPSSPPPPPPRSAVAPAQDGESGCSAATTTLHYKADPSLSAKERDSLRAHHLSVRKLKRAAQEDAVLQFRHAQTVKRWEAGKQDVKPAKVIFLSDFFEGEQKAVALNTQSQQHQRPSSASPSAILRKSASVAHGVAAPVSSSSQCDSAAPLGGVKVHKNRRHMDPSNGPQAEIPAAVTAPLGAFAEKRHAKKVRAHHEAHVKPSLKSELNIAAEPPQRDASPVVIASVGLVGANVAHPRSVRRDTAEVSDSRGILLTASGRPHKQSSLKQSIYASRRQAFVALEQHMQTNNGSCDTTRADADDQGKTSSAGDDAGVSLEEASSPVASVQGGESAAATCVTVSAMRQRVDLLTSLYEDLRVCRKNNSKVLENCDEPRKLQRAIRKEKQRLARTALAVGPAEVSAPDNNDETAPSPDGTDGDGDAMTTELTAPLRMKFGFFPSLIQLAVGMHPHASVIDLRMKKTAPADDDAIRVDCRAVGLVREYCVNLLTTELDQCAVALLAKLQQAQKKLKTQQPMHFKSRMRYLSGLKEVLRSVRLHKVRLVLVAPDVEADTRHRQQDASAVIDVAQKQSVRSLGLDGSVRAVVDACAARGIPWACCLSRQALGHALRVGASAVSCVAILSADGAYDEYKALVAQIAAEVSAYSARLGSHPESHSGEAQVQHEKP